MTVPGIVASQLIGAGGGIVGGGGTPEWVPEGASVHIDFVNDRYFYQQERTAAELIDGPLHVTASGYDVSALTPTMGEPWPTGSGLLVGALQQAFAAGGFSLRIAFEGSASTLSGPILMLPDNADIDAAAAFFQVVGEGAFIDAYADGTADAYYGDTPSADFTGVHAYAMTAGWPAVIAGAARWRGGCSLDGSGEEDGFFSAAYANNTEDASAVVPQSCFLFGISEWDWFTDLHYVRSITLFPTPISTLWLADLSLTGEIPVEPAVEPAHTVLDVSFDGADGATAATDASPSAHALTFVGDAELDTAIVAEGTASLKLAGAGRVTVPNDADFHLAGEPFSIAMKVYFTSLAADVILLEMDNPAVSADTSFRLRVDPTATSPFIKGPRFHYSKDGNTAAELRPASDLVLSTGAWYDLVVSYTSEGVLSLLLDGAEVRSQFLDVDRRPFFTSTADLSIGARLDGTNGLTGHIDKLVVTKGATPYG